VKHYWGQEKNQDHCRVKRAVRKVKANEVRCDLAQRFSPGEVGWGAFIPRVGEHLTKLRDVLIVTNGRKVLLLTTPGRTGKVKMLKQKFWVRGTNSTDTSKRASPRGRQES
jgi:hypothetical protein